MAFKDVEQRKKYGVMEHEMMEKWRTEDTFEKSVAQRDKKKSYVFYDGPPFITGVPHYGTLLSSIIKDVVPRYWTMKGKRVERRWGWDCHGLPAENLVEKKLGIKDKRDVAKVGLKKYIQTCHSEMVAGGAQWEEIVERIGRWVNFKGAYKTMDRDYMESVWWAFKELYNKGKIYEGEKVLMYCTRCATPISKAEVSMDNSYQVITDPSVYVKFPVVGEEKTYFLAWTTTPWTLVANTALAVNKDITYAKVAVQSTHKNIFLISGKHAFASNDYFPQLKKDLEAQGYNVTIIDHSEYDAPVLADNMKMLQDYDFSHAHVVTHSLGASTILKFIEEVDVTIASLTMIAPAYPGKSFRSTNKEWVENSGYVGFELDFGVVRKKILGSTHIVYSDETTIQKEHFLLLGEQLGAEMHHEEDKDHFFTSDFSRAPNYKIDFTDKFILAKELLETVLTDEKHKVISYEEIEEMKGEALVGMKYVPLFGVRSDKAHTVLDAHYVTTEDGTGIVHIAPAYGEEDFALAKKEKLPVVHTVDENGEYTEGPWKGKNIWEHNKTIAKDLKKQDVVWKIAYVDHEYPHCHRCSTKLMYSAHPSWFMDIEGQRDKMIEKNENINWFPAHFKSKRFKHTVETAPDWNLSRDRFWATPFPVWKCDAPTCEGIHVIGSYEELKDLSGQELKDYHRPYIDEVTFPCRDCSGTMRRIEKVLDCWFESGSMPFAQFHYPFENKEKFEENFPGDFIAEYVGQVRAWFYYLHAVSIGLFGKEAFKNVIVTGTIAGNDGKKMSKSLGNYTDPNELLEQNSADALRYLLVSSPLLNGDDYALIDKDVADVQRKLGTLWNSYSFFVMYANVDKWQPEGTDQKRQTTNILDEWIMSRLHALILQVDQEMMHYDLPRASKPIMEFIDDLSNWYIRRSRKRFWKSEDDGDKDAAYATLHDVLVELSKVIAPFTPFIAEEIYTNLTGKESVHLADFPVADERLINGDLNVEMKSVRDIISEGLQQRARAQLKVRQPIALLKVKDQGAQIKKELVEIIKEEMNVKQVALEKDLEGNVWIDVELTPELKREGQAREIIRHIQKMRKEADYQVDDRISVGYEGMTAVFEEYADIIAKEVLATTISQGSLSQSDLTKTVKIDEHEITVSLQKN